MKKIKIELPDCKCGCGQRVKKSGNKYILGHNSKDKSTAKTHLWQKGESGNPKGRPHGSRNQVTISTLNLIEGESEALSRKAIEQALSGNTQMLKFCCERFVPACKDSPVKIDLPAPKTVDDVTQLTGTIIEKLSNGELTPSQAELIGRSADRHLKSLQINDLESRLAELEELINEK